MRSVFTKLSIIILVAVVLINLLVFGLFRSQRRSSIIAFQNIQSQYLEYLIKDIGTPPAENVAKDKINKGLICIRYDGKEASWSTDTEQMPKKQLHWHQWAEYPHIHSAVSHVGYLIKVTHGDGTYYFEFGRNYDQEAERHRLLMLLIIVLTTLFVVIYLSIRWILKPIKWLKEGVHEITRGNLTHRVPAKRSDELKDLAEAFNAMTERIREMLLAKERLLLDVSHEMRSPLTRMRVAVEFLPESHAKISIQTDIREMEKMISEVLETAKHHHRHAELNPETIDLSEVIKDLIPIYDHQHPGVLFIPPRRPVMCHLDVERVRTALQNIMDNAIKYSGASSQPVEIALLPQKTQVCIQIKDHGIGIPEEELPYILEPFYRVDKSRSKQTGGYGLGLSICKTIMEAHGGKIALESRLGKGTTVTLIFPC